MQQLLKIESVPISIEYKYSHAADDSKSQSAARLRITQADDGVTIRSNPISIRMDSYDSKRSGFTGMPSSNKGLTYDATARYADNGDLQLDIHLMGDPIEGLDFQRIERSIENVMGSISASAGTYNTSASEANMRINFRMSGVSLDSNAIKQSNINFFPGDLEFEVTEYPKLIIKYIGKPIYIPKSADPDYVPPEKLDILV